LKIEAAGWKLSGGFFVEKGARASARFNVYLQGHVEAA
jgi:hypothetical protein